MKKVSQVPNSGTSRSSFLLPFNSSSDFDKGCRRKKQNAGIDIIQILHKLKLTIRFDYVFQVCGLMDATPKNKYQSIHEGIKIFGILFGGAIPSFFIKKWGLSSY